MAVLAVETHWSHFVPLLALVFTVASFWWMWLRRGTLRTFAPSIYAGYFSTSSLRVRFALVLTNSAGPSIAVENLRAVVDGQVLEWMTVRSVLRPDEGDLLDFPKPFAVPGRQAVQVAVEFGADGAETWQPAEGPYRMRVEWLDRESWRELVTFDWWPPSGNRGAYIAHGNRPAEARAEDGSVTAT